MPMFVKNWEMDVTVLRLAHLYHIPKSLEDADNLPAGMCIEALRDGAVRADESHEFSLLHENDAVEYIYRATISRNISMISIICHRPMRSVK